MSDLHIYVTLGVFATVILAIAFDVVDMALAAMLGVSCLVVFGILNEADIVSAMRVAGGPLLLLFGGMVVARVLSTTGVFERVGNVYLRATKGSGKRFLLLLFLLVAPLCALLPNATTVVLLAPIIIRVAKALDIDFVPAMVLAAIISNSAGLLTLVGDPATFLVGSSIGMSFGEYLRKVSLGGVAAVLVPLALVPVLMPDLWRMRRPLPPAEAAPPIKHPWFAAASLAVLAAMVVLFVVGEELPTRIVPPAVAVIGASLALLVAFTAKLEPLDNILGDIDWKTLVFLAGIFCLVEAFAKTGLLQIMALQLHAWFGSQLMQVAMMMILGIGLLSSLLANVPVVAGSLVMIKGYLVAAAVVPEMALAPEFTAWPAQTLPVFIAMMFGATLGGNATLIGASANVVAAGACAANGRRLTFARFLRYGLPIMACQLAVSAGYVYLLGRFAFKA
ncbi:SLC13 family permease [Ramlibacter sp. PS3R-8]|uniref:SLC13 family permease n=1 Tax=Ramlibacter sp. PS3R-8 TaxID=3133437 RepID=UPI0030A24B65